MLVSRLGGSWRSRYRALVATFVMSAAVSGCASSRQPLPYQLLAQLKPGSTTMAEAEAVLGPPEETSARASGEQEWVYYFAPEPAVAAPDLPLPTDPDRRLDVLLLVFSPAGTLIRHEVSRSLFGVRDAAHPPEPDHEALKDIPLG